MTFCKLKTPLSRNFVYNVQTFQGFCQVRFTILLQIPLIFSFLAIPYPFRRLLRRLLQSLYFSRFLPNCPRPLISFDTRARWQPVTQSARSRRSYWKIEDCEQSRPIVRRIRNSEEIRLSETLTYVLAILQDIWTSFCALIRRQTIQMVYKTSAWAGSNTGCFPATGHIARACSHNVL